MVSVFSYCFQHSPQAGPLPPRWPWVVGREVRVFMSRRWTQAEWACGVSDQGTQNVMSELRAGLGCRDSGNGPEAVSAKLGSRE